MQRYVKTALVAGALLLSTFGFSATALAAPACPPEAVQSTCSTIPYPDAPGTGQISYTLASPQYGYPAGTFVRIQYNADNSASTYQFRQGSAQGSVIGTAPRASTPTPPAGGTPTTPPAGTPTGSTGNATVGACTQAQTAQGMRTWDLRNFDAATWTQYGAVVCAQTREQAMALALATNPDDGIAGNETETALSETGKFATEACDVDKTGTISGFENVCYGLVYAFMYLFNLQNFFYWMTVLLWAALSIAQVFLGFAMWWFDGAIYYTIILMGVYINNKSAFEGISMAWGVIRDLANILIIGGFVAVGISTILQVAQYAADKFLVKLIIAALLVNFSFFFTGAIIDGANYLTIQIYNSDLVQNDCPVGGQEGTVTGLFSAGNALFFGSAGSNTDACSLAASMMAYTRMTSWKQIRALSYQSVGIQDTGDFVPGGTETQQTDLYFFMMVLLLLGTIFALLMSWVLMQGAFMLIVRFAALIFLLVTSPIGIAGVSVPFVNQFASRWWTALFSQAMFAPIYIFFFAVSLTIVKNFDRVFAPDKTKSFADAAIGLQGTPGQGWLTAEIPIFIVYFLAIACMWLSYQFAKQIADSVPEFKPLYDMASKGAQGMWMAPKRLGFDTPAKLFRLGLDEAAARTKEKGTARWALTNLSGLLRTGERVGSSKKHEKSGFAEANEEITSRGRAIPAKRNEAEVAGGFFAQPWNTGSRWGGLLKQDPSKWSESDKKKVKGYLDERVQTQEDMDDLIAEHGAQRVNEWVEAGVLSKPEQLQKIRNSKQLSDTQKSQMTESYFRPFLDAFKTAASSGKAEDWDAAMKQWKTLDDTERAILLAERAELRASERFMSSISRKEYDAGTKGLSKEERIQADESRKAGVKEQLGAKRDDESAEQHASRIKGMLKRMSDDEIAELDEETALRNLPHMTPAQKEVLYKRSTGRVTDALRNDPDVQSSTRLRDPAPQTPAPPIPPAPAAPTPGPAPEPGPAKPDGDKKPGEGGGDEPRTPWNIARLG